MSYLADYRKWILNRQLSNDSSELKDIKNEIENVLRIAQKQVFLKHLNPESTFNSIGKTIIGTLADVFIPGLSTIASVSEELIERKAKNEIMWQGFIISARDQIK